MPSKLTCELKDVAASWAMQPSLIHRLNHDGRIFVSPNDKDLKCCNKHASFNAVALKPLLEKISEQPSWELFSLQTVTEQLLASIWLYRGVAFPLLFSTGLYIDGRYPGISLHERCIRVIAKAAGSSPHFERGCQSGIRET